MEENIIMFNKREKGHSKTIHLMDMCGIILDKNTNPPKNEREREKKKNTKQKIHSLRTERNLFF